MIYPLVKIEKWARHYSLNLTPKPCGKCSKPQTPTIPFAHNSWRGVLSELHDCGPPYQLAVARDVENDWKEVFDVVTALGEE